LIASSSANRSDVSVRFYVGQSFSAALLVSGALAKMIVTMTTTLKQGATLMSDMSHSFE
jgi:hypothetical protein